MEIDSIKLTLPLATEKVQKVVKTCQDLLRSHSKTFLELTKVTDILSSTTETVEPVCRYDHHVIKHMNLQKFS